MEKTMGGIELIKLDDSINTEEAALNPSLLSRRLPPTWKNSFTLLANERRYILCYLTLRPCMIIC